MFLCAIEDGLGKNDVLWTGTGKIRKREILATGDSCRHCIRTGHARRIKRENLWYLLVFNKMVPRAWGAGRMKARNNLFSWSLSWFLQRAQTRMFHRPAFLNLVLINRRNGPRYQRVLALCDFLTGVIPGGLVLRKFCVRCLCMFCFMSICVGTDFVVYG